VVRRTLPVLVKTAAKWAGLTLLALVVDMGLWHMSPLLDQRGGDLKARCQQITPGMSREQVLQSIEGSLSLSIESETKETQPVKSHELRFFDGDCHCDVMLDPETAIVVKPASTTCRPPERPLFY
jgi:hypothetical protein